MKMTKVIVNFYYLLPALGVLYFTCANERVAISFTAFVNTQHKKTLMKRKTNDRGSARLLLQRTAVLLGDVVRFALPGAP